jgi:hypothetical protein
MVARRLSSYDVTSSEHFVKRPSVYIDPESDIFEGLEHLQNLDHENCVNCLQIWKNTPKAIEGKSLTITVN